MAFAAAFFGVCLVFILVYSALQRKKPPKSLRLVPGPRGLPILGNLHQLPPYPQQSLQRWAREYGDMFQIRMGWENWIFLNDPAVVKELLDKQSAVTSGRAPSPVASDIISGGKRFLFMSYTPEWRKLRTIVHKLLTPKASALFKPSQELEARQLIYDIHEDQARNDQESFYMHCRRYSTSVIMTSTYGRRVPQWDCEDVREVYTVMNEFSEHAAPGAYLAEMIPPLAKIPVPLQWWRGRALKCYHRQLNIWWKYWTTLKQQIADKTAPECFVKQYVATEYEKEGIDEEQSAFLAGSMIEAGSETTSSALNSAIKYLAAFPGAQARAHEEITRVVGDSRSPGFDDEDNLPFLRATVKEVLRIRPVTNIGTPHYTTADIVYKDFFIPKNTVLSINQYAIHFDQRRYDEPEKFKPERYLDHPLKAGAYIAHPDPYARDHFGFGAGRRGCPGLHLAENSLFITLAKILWAFEIKPALGPDGKEEVVDVSDAAYEDGSNTVPRKYKVRFVMRNEKREMVLKEEWDETLRALKSPSSVST
ncbi:hypothetical protein PV08_07143 [Exophiala spinifera]|uniref:O-methylsterigmatocystin oxidoreductase n=1 Tax=Exophiala spinifera TaxID=91928 RepID=A0A0D1YHE7_9EURO|nr:uncharacterized protein PV08_07143 [Exophiala spinifera]KIW14361.1 hypothetical protein PV08_07143 [Exophiala spinifera]